ncbi:MAG: hypothetical protein A2431_03275 [Candidatus Zambryskibacteria bacterium RIFOXYC1_FULL_39_10]|uniref:Uncharacterized protein n=1 Tax=Candidatus Zambryskibacteria bacterium RIFOXYC1_FULL_39_10 TaxID=1802779 RepID=A0A1G2UYS3_9BACT|nr:MAG: hypothetical protein A2431_03275 [Candidatus Zambryskibacteria bacterium RIFOXYC1_FULL_39_10]OHB15431.1 MAG: hypothetical protein A2605_03485 [Candidatus Zambryskibacteria bacterium RIFOXYD1_FULL_39_35]
MLDRYIKILKTYYKIYFKNDSYRRTIREILQSKPKRFFYNIKILTFHQLVEHVRKKSDKELSNEKDIQEMLDTLPLLLSMIIATKEKWCIGKIVDENNPFDICMAPAKYIERKENGRCNIFAGSYIQTKRMMDYPLKGLTKDEWVEKLQNLVNEHTKRYDLGHNGAFHFYCLPPFSEQMLFNDFELLFKKIKVPKNNKLEAISVSIPVFDKKTNTETVCTWFIYPLIFFIGPLSDLLPKAHMLYVELDVLEIMQKAIDDK